MFLTISASGAEGAATDLGYLLHKHPDRAQTFSVSMGQAHVFFPVATPEKCTVALLLEVDPIGLVRNKRLGGTDAFTLAQYVNDRPYAASSMLAVALGKVFATARAGRCDARPELPGRPLDLTIAIPALPCRGGPEMAARLFEPLGWRVAASAVPLDPAFADWGDSRYVELTLTGRLRLADALQQLYVLLPVLDDAKHYWVGPDEVDKLLRAGSGWLAGHPEAETIAYRYLAHRRTLATDAVDRLLEVGEDAADDAIDTAADGETGATLPATPTAIAGGTAPATSLPAPEVPAAATESPTPTPIPTPAPIRLADARAEAILAALAAAGAESVVDLGCGEGRLLARLLDVPRLSRILGVDVSIRALRRAADRLGLERLPERRRARIELAQSSLTYLDPRIAGFDAAVLQEVIEHVDPARLPTLAHNVFGHARPGTVIVTTPNAEYNVRYPTLDGLRHHDHRFEWTRAEFEAWASTIEPYGYTARIAGAGPADPEVGCPTQLAVFTRSAA